ELAAPGGSCTTGAWLRSPRRRPGAWVAAAGSRSHDRQARAVRVRDRRRPGWPGARQLDRAWRAGGVLLARTTTVVRAAHAGRTAAESPGARAVPACAVRH